MEIDKSAHKNFSLSATQKQQNPQGKKKRHSKLKHNNKDTQLTAYCSAKSMLSDVETELGLNDLFSGELTHASFDCPKNLREAFKQETKDNGTSVCKELQKYMLSYIATSRLKKHALGHTLSKAFPVELSIENLNFEQYVQNRPRRLLRAEDQPKNVCGVAKCNNAAVARALWLARDEEFAVCSEHLAEAKANRLLWKVLS